MKCPIHYFLVIITILLSSCDFATTSNSKDDNTQSIPPKDEYVPVEEEYEDDCDNCSGYGRISSTCTSCNGAGEKHTSSTGTRPKDCYYCNGLGKIRCEKCGGYGYTKCQYCKGRGKYKCTVCHGYGIIILDRTMPHLSPQCNNCEGSGYEKCTICRGAGRMDCCNNGVAKCPVCWGSGKYGSENYSYSDVTKCSVCGGDGTVYEICLFCNGSGKVMKTRIIQKKK